MKKLNYLFLLLVLVLGFSCSKESENAQDVAKKNLSRGVWRAASATVNGIPAPSLPVTPKIELDKIKISFKSDGTYSIDGIALYNINATGTWKFDGSGTTDLILSPTNQKVAVENLTETTATIKYSFPTAGTQYSALGSPTAVVIANLVSP